MSKVRATTLLARSPWRMRVLGVGTSGEGVGTVAEGMTSTMPVSMRFGSAMLLRAAMSSAVVPKRRAMEKRVSPGWTV
jgi:hypothetical protein